MAVIPDSCPRRLGSGVSDLVLRLTLAGEIVEIGLGPLKRGADGHGLQRCGIRNNGKAGLRHCFVPEIWWRPGVLSGLLLNNVEQYGK
jgi:hypothetical protein